MSGVRQSINQLLHYVVGGATAATPVIDFSQIQVPSASLPVGERSPSPVSPASPEDPATLREMLLASPHDLAMLKERNPPLAEALLSGSLGW
jgi:DNA damage-inducible protein 1